MTDTVRDSKDIEKAALLGIYRVRSGTDPVRRPQPGVCRALAVLPQYPNTVTRTELSNFLRSFYKTCYLIY